MPPPEAAARSAHGSGAPSLLQVQRAMARALSAEGESYAEAAQLGLSREALVRLDIHRNNRRSVLVNALRLGHPAVERLVGAGFFEAAARRFIDGRLPSSAWLDEYGAEFSAFLSAFEPAATVPYLADVARVDWAANIALHAPDAEALDPQRLARLPDDEQVRAGLRFVPHPSLSLLWLACPADAIWRAVLSGDEAAMRAIDPADAPVWLLVERGPDGDVQLQRLSAAGWQFTQRLCAGEPLQAALEARSPWPGTGAEAASGLEELQPEEAQALLAEHLCAGRFIDVLTAQAPGAGGAPAAADAAAGRVPGAINP